MSSLRDILLNEKEAKYKRMYIVCYLSRKKEVYEKTYMPLCERNTGKTNQELMRLLPVRSGWDEVERMREGVWGSGDEVRSNTSFGQP